MSKKDVKRWKKDTSDYTIEDFSDMLKHYEKIQKRKKS
jgi:hypothetical protein